MSERDWLEVGSRYVGLPYLDGGRDRSGLDCWGLVRLFYAEELGVELPSYGDAYSSAEELAETAAAVRRGLARWRPAPRPEPGDVALLWIRRPSLPSHVGVYLGDRRMLHAAEGSDAAIERLDSPFWARRVAGYYRHEALCEAGWTLSAQPSPFTSERRELALPRGTTIADGLARAGFTLGPGGVIRVAIGDEPISPRWWDRMRPRPGTRVYALSVPGDPITIGALLATLGTALASTLPVAGPLVTGAILTAFPGAALTGAAAIGLGAATLAAGAAIAIGASFALTAIVSSISSAPEQSARGGVGPGASPAASGVGNRLDPFGPVPVSYGTNRVFPPLAAPGFTEIIGGERYWRLLLCVGAGRYQISDVEVGGVPIDQIPGAEIELVEGGVPGTYDEEVVDTEPVDDSPVAYWRLGDVSAPAVNTIAGGPSLAATGGVTFGRPSILPSGAGKSVEFDGSSGFLDTGSPPALDLAGDWTAELWVEVDKGAPASSQVLLALGTSTQGIWILRNPDRRLEVAAPGFTSFTGPQLEVGKHYHIALRRKAGTVQLWVNGDGGTPRLWTLGTAPTRYTIGARQGGGGVYARFFKGRVQEVALYPVALSDDEIRFHSDLGEAPKPSAPPATRGPRIRLYRDTALEVPVNIRFDAPPSSEGGAPIFGQYVTRSIPGEVEELHFEVFFGSGLGRINEEGKTRGFEVLLDVEYRLEGADDDAWQKAAESAQLSALAESNAWRVFTNAGVAPGAVPGIRVAGFIQEPMLLGWRWPVPRGRYEVRHRRVDLEGAGNRPGGGDSAAIFASYELLAFRGVALERAPVRAAGLSLIGLLLPVKETGSTVGQISCVSRRMLPIYDPDDPQADPVSGFTPERVTDSGAWAALDWLRSPYSNPRPVLDAKIDLEAFKAWATRAAPTHLVVDFRTNVKDGFNLIAGASFASLGYNGRWTVVEDRAGLSPVALITPRNSRGLSGVVRFWDGPHALRANYIDAERGYQERELVVYDDGYSEDGSVAGTIAATKFETIEIRGLTSRDAVRKHVRIRLAMARLRREEWRTEIELDHLRLSRGEAVRLQHWAALVGQAAGRVIARTEAGGFVSSVELDERVIFDGAISYGAVWRKADGSIHRANVTNPAALSSVVTFTGSIAVATAPEVGDLITVGERNEETVVALVRDVIRKPGFTAAVSLIPYEEGVFAADEGPVPFDPIVARPIGRPELAAPLAPVILSIDSDERYLAETASGYLSRLRILARPRAGSAGEPAYLQARTRKLSTEGSRTGTSPSSWSYSAWEERFPAEIFLGPVETGELYEVQARASTREGVSSSWSSPVVHRVVGETSLPPNVPSAQIEGDALAWEYPSREIVRDLAGFLLRWRTGAGARGSWESARPLHPGVWPASPFPIAGRVPADRPVTVYIKAVDRGGRESAIPARLVFTRRGALGNVILTVDHRALGWPGDKTDCAVDAGDLAADLTANDGTQPLFPTAAGVPIFPEDPSAPIFGAHSKACSYVATFTPGTESIGRRLALDAEVTPERAVSRLDYRFRGPGILFPEDPHAPLFPSSGPLWDPEWSEWLPWPGALESPARKPYEWRLSIADLPGDRARVKTFTLESDVDDLVESLRGVPISAAGSRLPLTKAFREIRHVSLTLQYVAGQSARFVRLVDVEAFGPLVEALTETLDLTAGTVDAEVRGVPLF